MVERVAQSKYLDPTARFTVQGLRAYELAKRALDLVFAISGLMLSAPVIILIGVVLKLDTPGPVFFRQERIGRFGGPFQILKFRTMRWPPEEEFHRNHVNQLANGGKTATHMRIAGDPRVTRVGRFLRKWSLDELPNLWNVLRGEMSLVGPRPLVRYEVDDLAGPATRRLDVRPGLTGLAQVSGRLDVSASERLNHDLLYVVRRSLLLDLVILLRTPLAVLRGSGI